MGQFNLPPQISLSDLGPPPNANFHPKGKHQSLLGNGSPENRVLGYTGDEYLDLDNGDKWNKMGPTDEPRRATVDGWEVDAAENLPLISTGTSEARTVADRFAEARNLRDFGDLDDGVATLTAALAEWDQVVIDGTVSVASNLTIAAGKVLIFRDGGTLKPASGVKVTISGEVQAPRIQIFDYTAGGKVVFTAVGIGVAPGTLVVYPEWYGAKADNTVTNNDAAFGRYYDQTLSTTENQHPLVLGMGYYDFTTGWTARSNMVIRGHPNGKTRLQFSPTAASGTARFITMPDGADNPTFENLNIIVRAVTAGVRTIAIGHTSAAHSVTNPVFNYVTFTAWNQYALDFGKVTYLRARNCLFTSVSNISANGGTGAGSAICVNIQTFGNALSFNACRTSNCEQLFKSASSSSVFFSDECAFEQGPSAPLDAITGRGSFIEVTAGNNIHIDNNYIEGIITASTNALISLAAVKGWTVNSNTITGVRSGESTCMSDIFISQTGLSYGGEASGNQFYGTPANFYIKSDGSGGMILALANIYRDNTGVVQTTTAAIQAKMSMPFIDFNTPTERNVVRAQYNRLYFNSGSIVIPFLVEHNRTSGVGVNGEGVGIRFRGVNGAGSVQNIGEINANFVSATDTTEIVDLDFWSAATGPFTRIFSMHGAGGATSRGLVAGASVKSAVDITVLQSHGVVILTADAKTATIANSTNLRHDTEFLIKLAIGGAGTGTVAFANGSDLLDGAATYSLSADYKYVKIKLVDTNQWTVIGNN